MRYSPAGRGKTVAVWARVDADTKAEIERIATSMDISQSAVLEALIADGLNRPNHLRAAVRKAVKAQ